MYNTVPPDQKTEQGSEKTVLDQIDAVQHFGASWSRKGLRNAEQLLVKLLVDPFCLGDEPFVELGSKSVSSSTAVSNAFSGPLEF